MSNAIFRLRNLAASSAQLKPTMVAMIMHDDPEIDMAKANKWVDDQAKFEREIIMAVIAALVTGVDEDTVASAVMGICGAIVGTIYEGVVMPNKLFEDVLRAAVTANQGGGLAKVARDELKRVKS
jgi:hypothetical protein